MYISKEYSKSLERRVDASREAFESSPVQSVNRKVKCGSRVSVTFPDVNLESKTIIVEKD